MEAGIGAFGAEEDSSFVRTVRTRARRRTAPGLAAAVVAVARGVRAVASFASSASWTLADATCRLSQGAPGRVARATLAVASGVAVLAAAGVYQSVFLDPRGLPDLDAFLHGGPPTVGVVEDARGEVLAELAREYRRPLEEHEMPPVMRDALLAAEDKNFFEHHGVDLGAWPRVLSKTIAASRLGYRLRFPQGGSTLTQQLVRVAFLSEWRERENEDRLVRDTLPNRLFAAVLGPLDGQQDRSQARGGAPRAVARGDASPSASGRAGSRRRRSSVATRCTSTSARAATASRPPPSTTSGGRWRASGPATPTSPRCSPASRSRRPTYAPVPENATRVLRRRNQILALMEREG